jgi:DNA-binding NarL/FixJ family response regulator
MRGEAPKIAELTRIEREIVQLMCEGLKDGQIADHLQLSASVVVSSIESIFEKLEAADRLELVIYAHLHGLAKKPDEDFSERAACRKVGGIAIGDGAA